MPIVPVMSMLNSMSMRKRASMLVGLDIFSWYLSLALFLALRYIDNSDSTPWTRGLIGASLAAAVHVLVGSGLWLYRGRYRIGSKDEAVALSITVGFTFAVILLAVASSGFVRLLPLSTVVAGSVLALFGAVGSRVLIRIARENSVHRNGSQPAIIFGAGSAGIQLIENMLNDPNSPFTPVALLDDNAALRNMRIRGVDVSGSRNDVVQVARRTGAKALVIAVTNGSSELYRVLNSQAQEIGLDVKTLPPLSSILDGRVGIQQLSDINLSDVLGRQVIETNTNLVAEYLKGKRVLVTGAGGSIGSELCRQIAAFSPESLIMLDRDESALHGLQLSMTGRALLDSKDLVLADIRDLGRLNEIFSLHKPQVVFHAAALKHLPMLESAPAEAWKTNVVGTFNVLSAAKATQVEVFVNISTDKAADPQSVLGYSKRIAERITASFGQGHHGRYVSVRFGNVLGSRGSVLTTFADQIARGGPVTVTHPEVTRYFMTIPEAVQLVLQAAAFGDNGDALVLEMGTPVKIVEVAQQLISLSNRKVDIEFTGLRPGEKMHEDLTSASENSLTTEHHLIQRVSVEPLVESLEIISTSDVSVDHVSLMREMVMKS